MTNVRNYIFLACWAGRLDFIRLSCPIRAFIVTISVSWRIMAGKKHTIPDNGNNHSHPLIKVPQRIHDQENLSTAGCVSLLSRVEICLQWRWLLSSPGPKPLVSKPKPKGLGVTLKSYGLHHYQNASIQGREFSARRIQCRSTV